MRWPRDSTGWPFADRSRFVLVKPHRWHVQEAGTGPTILLIHGAGGATQSFRKLFPLLTPHFHTVMMDLPGQGFTQLGAQRRCGLEAMTEDLGALIAHERWVPDLLVGHSAGGAIALSLAAAGLRPACGIVTINAALGNFEGLAGWLFPAMAKALAMTPLAAQVFAATMTAGRVRQLIRGTGSVIDAEGEALYLRLASDRAHVDATLSMMAQWTLDRLNRQLPQIDLPVHLIVGARDTAVPPDISGTASRSLAQASLTRLANLGHLAHEEDADAVAAIIRAACGKT